MDPYRAHFDRARGALIVAGDRVIAKEGARFPKLCIGCGRKHERRARRVRVSAFPTMPDSIPRHGALRAPDAIAQWVTVHYAECKRCSDARALRDQVMMLVTVGAVVVILVAMALWLARLFIPAAALTTIGASGLAVLTLRHVRRTDPQVHEIEVGRVSFRGIHAKVRRRIERTPSDDFARANE